MAPWRRVRGAGCGMGAVVLGRLVPASLAAAQIPHRGDPPSTVDAITLGNAQGNAYHLLNNCIGAHARRCLALNGPAIDADIVLLESTEITRDVARSFRLSRARIEEGGRLYDRARTAHGRERSRLVEQGNALMEAAKDLLKLAIDAFRALRRSSRSSSGAAARSGGRTGGRPGSRPSRAPPASRRVTPRSFP